ncbi:hypothetical protein HMF7854_00235 [Sphingomonas ginkgonis]|uniref:Uncharacterized protein n=1 Tax=Sphingomonas ginkgonis TaxID=2315330 RepID=A0A3R9X5Q8_9SPHN|nr:hypothetical protein [Sphingomonas ginkgonis]RST29430.1 hypothetical protein HMF7854_00235 [Sphingomonas ginkgonis]
MARNFWQQLGDHLGVQVISPFVFQGGLGPVEFTALLTQFGAPRGMVVDGDLGVIDAHTDALLNAGYGYSCCEGGDYNEAEPSLDMLRDWEWSSETAKPVWL